MGAATATLTIRAQSGQRQVYRPWAMSAVLVITDLCSLSLAVAAGFILWRFVNPAVLAPGAAMLVAPASAVATFAQAGFYPGIGLTAVQQIRRSWRSITLVYLLLTAAMFLSKSWWADSRGGFFLAWIVSLAMTPWGRWISAHFFDSRPWWGAPVVVIGAGSVGRSVIRSLVANRILGYRPVVCVDDDARVHGECEGVPVLGSLADVELLARAYGASHAIVAIPTMPRDRLIRHMRAWSRVFPKIVILPNLAGVASLWTEPRDLGGLLGLEVRQNLLSAWNQGLKRAADVVLCGVGLVIAAPFLAVCAAWIKSVSPGSAFYRQEREGHQARTVQVLKLRTMYPNAEEMLEQHLAGNPEAREEWNRFVKLKHDPRILPGVGNFLRKTSLDELPQLWNILKGEMSLVGPRPFPAYHNRRFDPEFRDLRRQVIPGLTGLWQVSARSNGDLEVQTFLDSYYIRNWSLWLDLYILIRTGRAVLKQEGSY
ncbi:MAG TPA: undecaprenyl-phosphate galactose phosphotransferase WbaP [Bryobacteraceae bacterium]